MCRSNSSFNFKYERGGKEERGGNSLAFWFFDYLIDKVRLLLLVGLNVSFDRIPKYNVVVSDSSCVLTC